MAHGRQTRPSWLGRLLLLGAWEEPGGERWRAKVRAVLTACGRAGYWSEMMSASSSLASDTLGFQRRISKERLPCAWADETRWGGEKETSLRSKCASRPCGTVSPVSAFVALPLASLEGQIAANGAKLEDECQPSRGGGWTPLEVTGPHFQCDLIDSKAENESLYARWSHRMHVAFVTFFPEQLGCKRAFCKILPSVIFFFPRFVFIFVWVTHANSWQPPSPASSQRWRVLLVLAALVVRGGKMLLIHFQSCAGTWTILLLLAGKNPFIFVLSFPGKEEKK